MPEITVIHTALLALSIIIGLVVGWIIRGNRCAQEKIAVNKGWHEQLEAQRNENGRIAEQKKILMDQVSQFQDSGKDTAMRASELSGALKEAFERRDELQREIKDIRSELEVAVAQRDRLQTDIHGRDVDGATTANVLKGKDDKIFKLSRELKNWQNRLPPLIERFRVRDEEAKSLESELSDAQQRLGALEGMIDSDQTHIEAVDPDDLTDGLDASNDPTDAQFEADQDVLADRGFPDDDLSEAAGNADDNEASDDTDHDNADDGVPDNLKMIKGVGPAIEKTLNELGIFRFMQIAQMSEYDIERIAQRLRGFRARIDREYWIGQARDLHDQNTGEQH
jgi:predicted flap endonuclease-1-like 5' DNA nuclease/peptidoglycan hydrolase CwlO-like protein